MGSARGYRNKVVLDFETTFGVAPAAPAGLVLPVNSYGVKGSQGSNFRKTIRGTGTRNPTKPWRGNISVSGPCQVPVDSIAFAYWLKAMFGSPLTAGAGPYTHTFKLGDVQPSFLVDNRFSDPTTAIAYVKHNGLKINSWSMKLDMGSDAELVADFNIMGANETVGSEVYDSNATDLSFAPFEQFDAAITEGGSALAIASAFDFQVNFPLQAKYFVGGQGVAGKIDENDMVEVSGSITTEFENRTLLDKAIAGTESSIVLTFTSGTTSLAVTFNELQFERDVPTLEGPQGIQVTLPWKAYLDDHADLSCIKVDLTNGEDGSNY